MSEHVDATRRGALTAAMFGGVGFAAFAAVAQAQQADAQVSPTIDALIKASGVSGDIHDWAYNIGDWTATNRRMRKRWTANPEWFEFPGRSLYVDYLDGLMNVDQTDFPTQGFSGVTIRLFSSETKLWSIYWINSKIGKIEPPVVGGWKGNVGIFYGDDVDDGAPVIVRFIRTRTPPNGDRWEQAFSKDGGKTWEVNWTADFTRVVKPA